jgi:energy-coupling factor transporter ATP-binding protein EcfA2
MTPHHEGKMVKIADVVKLKTGYANFVNLKSAYEEAKENAGRMAMYRPTKSHRVAFERLCRGLYQPNDRKFYLLSGSYGTGKSHLCLMFANFLSRSSGDPSIKGFYENYEKLDPNTAKMLRNVRKDGQYLVAICDYHSGKRFEDVVLKAIFDACRAMGLDAAVQTEFDEGQRLLEEWEKKGGSGVRNFYEDFEKALAKTAPGISVSQLRSRLKEFDTDALNLFHAAFKETTGGLAFQPQWGNLIPIIRTLIKHQQFKDRFKGLAVLFDEFGFTLEKAAYAKDVLQGFMEALCKNEPNVIFVGCIHKDFMAYADRYTRDDAAVMSARNTPRGPSQ